MAKYKCGICKKYITPDEVRRTNGVQRFCADCAYKRPQKTAEKPLRRSERPRTASKKQKRPDMPDELRKRVMERDKHRCRFCGIDRNLHLHHIVYRSQGGQHEESNLITLCFKCHGTVHSDKKRWKPLLLGVVWKTYEGQRYTVPTFERLIDNEPVR